MKSAMVKIVMRILKILAVLTIQKYKPGIIGVTGSVGKTSSKEAIATVLRGVRSVRASRSNFNGEIGLPLTILADWPDRELKLLSRENPRGKNNVRKILFLIKVIIVSLLNFLFKNKAAYPEILILEYGADKPGDIKKLIEIARPQIAVVTALGQIPAHVEFYSDPEDVAREKGKLVESLPSTGFAVLNADDEAIFNMRDRTRAHILTFGFTEGAEVKISNFENRMIEGKPAGVAFKLEYGGSFVPIRIDGCFGKTVPYAAGAATGVGIVFGMHLVRISENLAYYEAPPHRLKLVLGVKGTYIIDDSYNASPLSMSEAINTVKDLKASRKIAVLGDMLEIGKYAVAAHENIGKLAAKVFDILVTVGPRAKFYGEAAADYGLGRRNILNFDTAEEAKLKVQDLIKKGDLILIKASWAIHLDKVVEEIRQV